MSIDTIGNFLTIIRNKIKSSKPYAVAPHSKMNEEIARILKTEGFIQDFEVDTENSLRKKLKIVLRYVEGESVIHDIQRVSKPSRRIYEKVKNIKPVIGGLGIAIISTSRGIMTDKKAKSDSTKIGGEILCRVW
ncbi:MAG: small subunit ribosomal protein S8 [Alteromonas naphthalenivorans]|jgi:small subunit ribosomal protein S8